MVLGVTPLVFGCTAADTKIDQEVEQTREHIVQTQDSVDRVREDLGQTREDLEQASEDLTGRARELADRAAEKSERMAEKLDGELSEVRNGIHGIEGSPQLDLRTLFDSNPADQGLNLETIKNRLAWGTLILEGEVKSLEGQVDPATLEDLTRDLAELTADLRALDDKPDSELQEAVASIQTKGRKLASKIGEIKAELS